MKPTPTQQQLDKRLSYNSKTGVFTWLKGLGGVKVGSEAGVIKDGYKYIYLNGKSFAASRLAWVMEAGTDPFGYEIDHINNNPLDNSFINLRLATHSQNQHNSKAKGYYFRKGKYEVRVKHNKQTHFIGKYNTKEEAVTAYRTAKDSLAKEFSPYKAMNTLNETPIQMDGRQR